MIKFQKPETREKSDTPQSILNVILAAISNILIPFSWRLNVKCDTGVGPISPQRSLTRNWRCHANRLINKATTTKTLYSLTSYTILHEPVYEHSCDTRWSSRNSGIKRTFFTSTMVTFPTAPAEALASHHRKQTPAPSLAEHRLSLWTGLTQNLQVILMFKCCLFYVIERNCIA